MSQFRVEKEGHVAWIINDRPQVMNAVLTEGWEGLNDLLDELNKDLNIRVAVICGEGKGFCGGADVQELSSHPAEFAENKYSDAEMRAGQNLLQDSTRKLRSVRFPVIAAIHGVAVGAGLEMTCACDLIVAEEGTRMGFPECSVAVTITNGGTFFASRVFGLNKAREMAYTGEFITAEDGFRLGAVSKVVAKGTVREEAGKLAHLIASRAPTVLALHKKMFDRALESNLENTLVYETECLLTTAKSLDHAEGAVAFLEKRAPKFTGF
ncbi:hypothetical protein A9Q81_15390 [Gammaproteobacteria bacterium 42_54_T18]|nr:hypothetical protein A9Q81_15390 [Gammaproteobacteria bacterium 42_54_T18]